MAENRRNISKLNIGPGPGTVVFGEVVYAPGGTCGPRMQQDYQLVVIHRGVANLLLDGRNVEIMAGHAILLAPGHQEHFLFSADSETCHSWCAISPAVVPQEIRRAAGCIGVSISFPSHLASLLKMAKALPPTSANSDATNGYGLGLGLALCFGFVLEAQVRSRPQNRGEEILTRLDDYVSREYSRPLDLNDLAEVAGVCPQHLMKLCRAKGRPTPIQALYARRLEVAADQLARTGLSIHEIAGRCGFANAFHFSRKFSRAYGRSPRAWRQWIWSRTDRSAEQNADTIRGHL